MADPRRGRPGPTPAWPSSIAATPGLRSEFTWFETACCRAALAGLAGRDGSGVSAAEASSEAGKAMALLKKAVGMGYRNADTFRTEPALEPLRNRDDFRLLMMDLEFPADPFAVAR